jgi:hypothetical protein
MDADLALCRQAAEVAAILRNVAERRWCTMGAMREPVMLREDAGGGGRPNSRNVLGERLEVCSLKPATGFFRDGCCDTSREDVGSHTICAVMTAGFLANLYLIGYPADWR